MWTHVSRAVKKLLLSFTERIVRQQLDRDVTAKLVAALVLSRLDYCNAVLAGLPASASAPLHLQWVPHAAARIVFKIKPCDRPLQELHWLPVAERTVCKLCLLVNKTTLGHTPDYIARASRRADLNVPRTCRRIGNRAFSIAASQAWNRLPTELKQLRSTASFRQKLKTHLLAYLTYGTENSAV